MSALDLEQRVTTLEQQIKALNAQLAKPAIPANPNAWLDKIYGSFANDPAFDEAMALGRKWRESQRPKPRVKKSAAKGKQARGK